MLGRRDAGQPLVLREIFVQGLLAVFLGSRSIR